MRTVVIIGLLIGTFVPNCLASDHASVWLEKAEQSRIAVEPELSIAYVDSILNSNVDEAVKAEALAIKGLCYQMMNKPLKALNVYRDGLNLNLAEKSKFRGVFLLQMGKIYFDQRSSTKAIYHSKMALPIFEAEQDTSLLEKTYMLLGQASIKEYNYDDAASYLEKAAKLIQDSSSVEMAEIMANLGRIHFKNGDLEKAEPLLIASFNSFGALRLGLSQADIAEQLIGLYKSQQRYSEASEYAHTAYESSLRSNQIKRALDYLLECSWIQQELRNYSRALDYQLEAKKLAVNYDIPKLPEVMVGLGQLYEITLDDSEALYAYLEAFSSAQNAINHKVQRKASIALVKYYDSRSQFEEALYYSQYSDSIGQLLAINQVAELQKDLNKNKLDEFDSIIQEQKSKINDLEGQRSTLESRIMMGLMAIIVVIALLFLREIARKKRLSKILEWKVYKRTRALRRANKDLNTYIYKSSHDLRTPLTSIKSLLRLLKTEDHTASTIKYLGLIDGCAEQMDDILINLSRAVDYKKVEVNVEKIDFEKVQQDLVSKELPEVPGVNLVWNIREKVPFYSDMKLIKVILNKTIGNALNYRQGTVKDYCKVNITTDSQGAIFSIEDNGVGISEKVKSSVFEMFVKGTNKSKGAGLGLYLAKIALDKLKGKVNLESEVNKGSKLIFHLPNLD